MSFSTHKAVGAVAPLVEEAELRAWLVYEDDAILVVNKPGWLVCHPSKAGPWSSLAGAVREYCGLETVHLVSRLDRETSGVVLFAKTAAAASDWQGAVQRREVQRTYTAIVQGVLRQEERIESYLLPDQDSPVYVKQKVVECHEAESDSSMGQLAVTSFQPVQVRAGYTLCRVRTETGRKHQIRAHAQALGYPLVGEKLYGVDETLYLEFVEQGWTDRLAQALLLPRQALHAGRLLRPGESLSWCFEVVLPEDLQLFWDGLHTFSRRYKA